MLAELGKSRLASNLNQLAKAANTGSLPVSPETEQALVQACEDVRRMRHALPAALIADLVAVIAAVAICAYLFG